jgi:hypothetical protein
MGLVDDHDKPTWFTDGKPDIIKMLDIAGTNAGRIPIERRAAVERGLFGAQGGGFALLADPAVREQIAALNKEMNSPGFKNRYAGFMENYNNQVTSQNARTGVQEFNVTMMEIGKDVLPSVNVALRNFKGILESVRSVLPGASNDGKIGGAALTGAAIGGVLGISAGPLGIAGGALAGGVLGTAAGFMESYGTSIDKGGSYTSPGKTGKPAERIIVIPQKPPPINLSLNIDGRALASAVTDVMGNSTGFATQAPAADGVGQFFSGDHNYPDK